MDTIFGAPLDALTADDVERFLGEATNEPLVWEGKADHPNGGPLHPGSVVKAIAAFANSERGGYLILGAERDPAGGWRLPGLTKPPSSELVTWAAQLAARVSPRPRLDGRELATSGSRGPCAVIWIPPVEEPPAITADGAVFMRVAGSSEPVTDQRVLVELFARGAAARSSAELRASAAVNNRRRARARYASFGAATPSTRNEESADIFSRSFLKQVQDIALRSIGDLFGSSFGINHGTSLDRSWIELRRTEDTRAEVQINRDGSVGIHFWAPVQPRFDPIEEVLSRGYARRVTEALVEAVRLTSPSYRACFVFSVSRALQGQAGDNAEIRRWWGLDASSDAIEGVERDLRRSCESAVVYEPE